MYCIIVKYGVGSWRISNLGQVYDDRERAANAARRLREEKADDPTLRDMTFQCKVVPLGDPDTWRDE